MVSPLYFYAKGDIRHFSVYATIRPLVPELRFGNALSGSSASRTPTFDRRTIRRRSRRGCLPMPAGGRSRASGTHVPKLELGNEGLKLVVLTEKYSQWLGPFLMIQPTHSSISKLINL